MAIKTQTYVGSIKREPETDKEYPWIWRDNHGYILGKYESRAAARKARQEEAGVERKTA